MSAPAEELGAAAAPAGCYLYAVVEAAGAGRLSAAGLRGIDGAPVSAVVGGALAAVVSPIGRGRIRPERRNLAGHQAVLSHLLRDEPAVLPMAFGLISAGEDAVLRVLQVNRGSLLRQLVRVAGKVELGLRVSWDVPNVYEYLVGTHPALRAARDRIAQGGVGRDEMIEIGQLFDRLLGQERDACYERVAGVLSRHGIDLRRSAARTEREVVNLSCLVARAEQDAFERHVSEAAAGFDNHHTFDISGPWAPHNFVELNLKL